MPADVAAPLQTALFARLSGASLGVQGIHDVAQQGAAFPYVVMGRVILTNGDTKSTPGHRALIRIHSFSAKGQVLKVRQIQGAIYAALHDQVLGVSGFSNFILRREFSDCWPDADGKIHGVCEYRALIESA